jgi:hypothetical protein
MALNEIYRKYFQKSKIFLYPLLDIPRGAKALPTETYLSWGSKYTTEDAKLVCLYQTKDDPEYSMFEAQTLIKHTRLNDYIKIDETTSALIFDFSDLKSDWSHVVNGKYSQMQDHLKQKILKYFNNNSANHGYIKSYLYPEFYFKQYAEILDVSIELLTSVGELCNKPDLEKEMLLISVGDLENIKILD